VEHGAHPGHGRRLNKSLDWVAEALAILGSLLLLGATLVWVADIAGRRSIGYSVTGLNDITQLLVMGFVALALPVTFLREQNVTVEFLADLLPRRLLAWLRALIAILTAVFVASLAWYAWLQAAREFGAGARSSTLAIHMSWFWAPVLLGVSLSALLCAVLAWRYSHRAAAANAHA
jgi:TRAP-type C4-dicarboxylate transport system permease small subunit